MTAWSHETWKFCEQFVHFMEKRPLTNCLNCMDRAQNLPGPAPHLAHTVPDLIQIVHLLQSYCRKHKDHFCPIEQLQYKLFKPITRRTSTGVDVKAFATSTAWCDLDIWPLEWRNLIRSSVWASEYSLYISSRLIEPFIRYRGNKVCPDKQTNKQTDAADGQPENMPLPTMSGGKDDSMVINDQRLTYTKC